MPGTDRRSAARRGGYRRRSGAAGTLALAILLACERREPPLREDPPSHRPPILEVQTSELQAGPAHPTVQIENPYAGDPWAVNDGERLYSWFNCGGCHGALGGGGIGPPFADDDWIYGGEPASIYQSIVQGRPEGMPSFGGRIPPQDVWKIAAYVRSLAGYGPEPPVRGPPGATAEEPPGGSAEESQGGDGGGPPGGE